MGTLHVVEFPEIDLVQRESMKLHEYALATSATRMF
jgi:hypothetical protein